MQVMGRITTHDSLYHIGSTLPHAVSERIHVDLCVVSGLVQQRVQCNECTGTTNASTDTSVKFTYTVT